LVDIMADTTEAITVTATTAVAGTATAHRHLVGTEVLVARAAKR